MTNHYWVHKARGKASDYPCSVCLGPARDWSKIHDSGPDTDPDTFWPLCRTCHTIYDDHPRERRGKPLPGIDNRGRRRPDVAARNRIENYSRKCRPGCGCDKHGIGVRRLMRSAAE